MVAAVGWISGHPGDFNLQRSEHATLLILQYNPEDEILELVFKGLLLRSGLRGKQAAQFKTEPNMRTELWIGVSKKRLAYSYISYVSLFGCLVCFV